MYHNKKEWRKTKERSRIFICVNIFILCFIMILGFDNRPNEGTIMSQPERSTSIQSKSTQGVDDFLEVKNIELKKELDREEQKRLQKYADLNNEHNLYLIAKLIASEYGSQKEEDLEKKIAVGLVVLNRVHHEDFPDTVKEVIFQKNQFQPISNGSWERKDPTEFDYLAAKMALENHPVVDLSGNSINEAVYFMNPDISTQKNVNWFRSSLTYVGVLGEHEFYH